jgi:formamidopyrimidine-DNA glycosylase
VPELPEVEVVRAGLEGVVVGAVVASVAVYDERSLRRHDGPSEDFVDRLTGRVFGTPQRRGKFLWVPLTEAARARDSRTESPVRRIASEIQDSALTSARTPRDSGGETSDSPEFPREAHVPREAPFPREAHVPREAQFPGEALVVHLGMSGQVLLRDRQTDDRLTRIRIELDSATHGPLRLNFVDQRIFGSMAIDALEATGDEPAQLVPTQVAHIARDPLDPGFDDSRFLARLAAKSTTIKRALLDQTLVSGIGNIYADEALWAARVHYDQPTATLGRPRATALLAEVRAVLGRALAEGGTSFDAQYLNVNGESGYFSHSLNAYGRQGHPCPRCGRAIVREQFMNRGSHFCPRCQRVRV